MSMIKLETYFMADLEKVELFLQSDDDKNLKQKI